MVEPEACFSSMVPTAQAAGQAELDPAVGDGPIAVVGAAATAVGDFVVAGDKGQGQHGGEGGEGCSKMMLHIGVRFRVQRYEIISIRLRERRFFCTSDGRGVTIIRGIRRLYSETIKTRGTT